MNIHTPVWILTFNRPKVLNRLISKFIDQGFRNINVFSNHPDCEIEPGLSYHVNVIINTLNSEESNSWCSRSWNTILIKNFTQQSAYDHNDIICIQDDTDISDDFGEWFLKTKENYDFIWGPAGDQFFYLTKEVFKKVGYWDERYIGCYCGDADWLKRVVFSNKNILHGLSIYDTHNWGFGLNPTNISNYVITGQPARNLQTDYVNQHDQLGNNENSTLKHSQEHYREKWGLILDCNRPCVEAETKRTKDIDWYPWATKKLELAIN